MELIKFEAAWCGPCRMMTPVVKKLSEETGIPVVIVNTDEDPAKAAEYTVSGIPTIILVDDSGMEISRATGSKPYPALKSALAL